LRFSFEKKTYNRVSRKQVEVHYFFFYCQTFSENQAAKPITSPTKEAVTKEFLTYSEKEIFVGPQ